MEEFQEQERVSPRCTFKSRNSIALMCFFGSFNVYSLRVNITVAIVAMVNYTHVNEMNSTCSRSNSSADGESAKNSGGVFNWDLEQQGLLLGCYFYGYTASSIPGGLLANRFGARLVFGAAMLFSSILTMLMPPVAYYSFEFLVAIRILVGLMQGVSFPATYSLWKYWAPPLERTKLMSIMFAGTMVGPVVTIPIAGVLAEGLGWETIFYFTGICGLICAISWLIFVHNTPAEHPWIADAEKRFIAEQLDEEHLQRVHRGKIPIVAVMTSVPVWAVLISVFVGHWGEYLLSATMPVYFSTVMGIRLEETAALSSLPYVLHLIAVIAGGYATDFARSRYSVRTVVMRKLNTTLGLLMAAVFAVLISYSGCEVAASVSFFTLAFAGRGLLISGCIANPLDLSPKFGEIIFSISNAVSSASGFVAPQVTGAILKDDPSLSQWQLVFWIMAAMHFVAAIFYIIFASGEEQAWSITETKRDGTAGISNPAVETGRDLPGTDPYA